jgi:hypothetical protein
MGTLLNPKYLRLGHKQFWSESVYSEYFALYLRQFFNIVFLLKHLLVHYNVFFVIFKIFLLGVSRFLVLFTFIKSKKLTFKLDFDTGRFVKPEARKKKKKFWKKKKNFKKPQPVFLKSRKIKFKIKKFTSLSGFFSC